VFVGPAEAGRVFGERIQAARPRSNRSVALIILSVMAVMAGIGFAFAWFTTESRRQRDHMGETAAQPASEVLSVAPAKLAALGYLPAGTDAVVAIHVGPLMARAETAAILRMMRADRANFGIHRLEQMTGLALEDIDHILLGLKMKEDILGRIFLIVQTRQPYDAAKVRFTLKARRPIDLPDKTVYPIAPEQIELGGALWCAGARTLVFALQPKDLDGLPAEPIAGVERFPAETQKLLTGLQEGTQAWVVGSSTNWDSVLFLLQFFGLADDDRQTLTGVRAFRGWLRCDKEVTGQLEVACSNETAADELAKYLARKGVEADHLKKMAEERLRAAMLLAELAKSLVHERKGERLRVRAQASLESLRQSLPRSVGAQAVN
jgi:hypothetical protein